MQIKPGTYCPLVKSDCLENKCALFTCVRGTDNNTGKEVDEWQCAIAWLPMLLINAANESRKTCAATESFRNEMVVQGQQTQQALLTVAQMSNGTLILENK
jgi:hypothetical protein